MNKKCNSFVVITIVLLSTIFLQCEAMANVGKKIYPNQIAIVFHPFGDREVESINLPQGKDQKVNNPNPVPVKEVDEIAGKYGQIDMVSGGRLPMVRPGAKVIIFPRGLQVYRFTENPSIESPTNQELVAGTIDGDIETDFVVHIMVMDELPDIKQRLINLIRRYNLLKYSGDEDVLVDFIQDGRFVNILRDRFTNYAAPKRVLDIVKDKKSLNHEIITYMNSEFNQYGLRFMLCSISSAIRVDASQRRKMGEIIEREINREMTKLTNEKINPIIAEINTVEVETAEKVNTILVKANAEAMKIETAALKKRIDTIVTLIGPENYHLLEKTIRVSNALEESSSSIKLMPSDTKLLLDSRSGNVKDKTMPIQ